MLISAEFLCFSLSMNFPTIYGLLKIIFMEKNNATWEEKMLVQLSKYEWVTVNQCDANSMVDGTV